MKILYILISSIALLFIGQLFVGLLLLPYTMLAGMTGSLSVKTKRLYLYFTNVIELIGNFLVIFLASWILNFDKSADIIMYSTIIYVLLSYINVSKRIKAKKIGSSAVIGMMSDPENYDPKSDLLNERLRLVCDIVGILAGYIFGQILFYN